MELGYNVATGLLVGLVGAALVVLIKLVIHRAPPSGPWHRRTWKGIVRSPVISAGLVVVIAASCVVVATRIAQGPPPLSSPATSAPETSVSSAPTPSATPTGAFDAFKAAKWGPARDVANVDSRPNAPMLNSIMDNPEYGDERNFFRAKLVDDSAAEFRDELIVEPGQVYTFMVIVNNDARDGGPSVEGTHLRIQMPGVAAGGAANRAFISSSNTAPDEIWDGVTLIGKNPTDQFALRYLESSAVLHTSGASNGVSLPEDVFRDGVLLGCDQLDGTLPSGAGCQSYVTFDVRIDQPNFTAQVLAKLDGTDSWSSNYIAAPGDKVTIAAAYRNTGTTALNDVVLRLNLPKNVHYVVGSASMKNARTQDAPVSDNLPTRGINVGSYGPGANVVVTFQVLVDAAPSDGSSTQAIDDFLTVVTSAGSKDAPLTLVWLK